VLAVTKTRIDEPLAARDLTRQEAESLTMLARHAVAMPGADRIRLSHALQIASKRAGKDGAGPNLRFGVHALRWRLCTASGGPAHHPGRKKTGWKPDRLRTIPLR
jgi:predicted nucleic acid-binding Zn ribbon protein